MQKNSSVKTACPSFQPRLPTSPPAPEQWKYKIQPVLRAAKSVDKLVDNGLAYLGGRVRTKGGLTVLVFNPLSWVRTDVATVSLPDFMLDGDSEILEIVDKATGKHSLAQRAGRTEDGIEFAFIAKGIPPLGYKLYKVGSKSKTLESGSEIHEKNVLENRFFRVAIDSEKGGLRSIYDKRLGRELLDPASPYVANQYLYVAGKEEMQEISTPLGAEIERFPTPDTPDSSQAEAGQSVSPVFIKAIISGRTRNTPTVESQILLYKRLPRIDIVNRLVKKETFDKEAVYFAFPFSARPPIFSYEGPNNIVYPARDMLRGACLDWFAVQHWVDVSGLGGGVTLAVPDTPLVCLDKIATGKSSVRFKPQSGSIFAYVMNNGWDVNYRAGQGGEFRFRYSLMSHPGGADKAVATRFGWEVANPFLTMVVPEKQRGPFKESAGSFLTVMDDNVMVLAFKRAENGDGWIVRLWRIKGKGGTVELKFPFQKPSRAVLTNLVEESAGDLDVIGKSVFVPLGARAVGTARIWFDR